MGNLCPQMAAALGYKSKSSVDVAPLLEISAVDDAADLKKPHTSPPPMSAAQAELGATLHAPSSMYADFVRDVMPDLKGKVAIVTGANAGIGYWATRALAQKGCTVVMACRDLSKANAAKSQIVAELQEDTGVEALIEVTHLDLQSFASVRAFAADMKSRHAGGVHMLLNNAGIMGLEKILTADGWDVQLQTNHLSHFLLAHELLDLLARAPGGGRVVSHSSMAHKAGRINAANLNEGAADGMCGLAGALPGAKPFVRYGQSKLANVLFAFELHRRLTAAGMDKKVKSVCVHPGFSSTNIFDAPERAGNLPSIFRCFAPRFSQSAEDGSLPLLLAATHGSIESGAFYGPEKGSTGYPVRCKAAGHANDEEMARELWVLSELACGCRFTIGDEPAAEPLKL